MRTIYPYVSTLEGEFARMELLDWRMNRVFAWLHGDFDRFETDNPLPKVDEKDWHLKQEIRQLQAKRDEERSERQRASRREAEGDKGDEGGDKPYVITDWQRLKAAGWNVPEGGVLPPRPKPPPAPPRPNKEMP